MQLETTFNSVIWKTLGNGAWYFVGLPTDTSAWIKSMQSTRHGFGSVRVAVKLGATSWQTSIFPDSKSNTYVLPLKAAVRKKEQVSDGDEVTIHLQFEPN